MLRTLTIPLIPPNSSMATVRSRCRFDVFLSFSGQDTRRSFTDHLYSALDRGGLRIFRDDGEIERGEVIKLELLRAIQQSRFSIVVFSKNYASSSWCLDELAAIIGECRRSSSEHRVLPVYYDVDPSEVGTQSGSFETAFSEYEKQIEAEDDAVEKRKRREKVDEWKKALKDAVDRAGMELKNQANGHESKFIQKIVEVIRDKLDRPALSTTPFLVGRDYLVENINKCLQDASTDVRIIGITGMGGIGKTTVAKHVYNLNFKRFEGCCFLVNVREVSEQPNGLVCLQKQFLSDILNRENVRVSNVDEGIMMIKDALCCKRVLLVLDDVDQDKQLDSILRMRSWFCPGSKIVITTRDKQLLKANGIAEMHEVQKLDNIQSLKLFIQHAFRQSDPSELYEECSKRVIHHCEGLPLALKVLGSSLCGKSLDVWQSALQKLEEFPNSQVHEKLVTSFHSLQDDHDKNLFLYVACVFLGMNRDFVSTILDGCDFHARIGIENLLDRCLLTINWKNQLEMHSLIRDMGKEIIRKQSPDKPGRRSIVCHYKDSYNVLRENSGTEAIKGFSFFKRSHVFSWDLATVALKNLEKEDVFETKAIERMCELRMLQLSDVKLTGCYKGFPKRLRWLHWHGFHLRDMPNDFTSESLVVLEMPCSHLKQMRMINKCLVGLKILDLSHSRRLTRIRSFMGLPNLERLILTGCVSLIQVHESIENVERLAYLNLEDCKSLKNLPCEIGKLKYLETLVISGCSNLEGLPVEISNMKSLLVFIADRITTDNLLPRVKRASTWYDYILSSVFKPRNSLTNLLVSLPSSLVTLKLRNCNLSLEACPIDLSNLSSLKELDISGYLFYNLPDCVKGLCKLETLRISNCGMIESLLGVPTTTHELFVNYCTLLSRISFRSTSFHSFIHYDGCDELVEINGRYKFAPIGRFCTDMIKLFGLCKFETKMNKVVKFKYFSHRDVKLNTKMLLLPIQGLYEYGIFSIFLPGIGIIPGWFSLKSKGSSLSLTVPFLPNLMIQGLNVCVVYELSGGEEDSVSTPCCEIWNKTKKITWEYSPKYFGIPEANKDMLWVSHWDFRVQIYNLEPGDELDVELVLGDNYRVKECGVEFVCSNHKEINPFAWVQVIGSYDSFFHYKWVGVMTIPGDNSGYLEFMGVGGGHVGLKSYPKAQIR